MKFITTSTLLLASLFGTVMGNDLKKKRENWNSKDKKAINDAHPYFRKDEKGNVLMTMLSVPACKNNNSADAKFNCRTLIARNAQDKEKRDRHLAETARKINERRRLEEESRRLDMTVEAAPGDGTFVQPQLFRFSGLEGATELKLVFSQENEEDVVYDFFDGEGTDTLDTNSGVAEAFVGLFKGETVTYTWSLYYTIGGQEEIHDGGEITFGPPGLDIANRNGNENKVREAAYEIGGQVQEAVGRIYFTSDSSDYACTGTAIRDSKSGRSLILTAAHCVFDDIGWQFGENAIFIPDRDAVEDNFEEGSNETRADIHRYCEWDRCGCWELAGGVVHDMWVDAPWPERLAYDYGFYVVNDEGAHTGKSCGSDALDQAVAPLEFEVGDMIEDDYITNFGYSLAYNPDFRYCAETAGVNQPIDGVDTAWMSDCGLTGGSSGGPWTKNFDPDSGTAKIVSVNSWSYLDEAGMGGPFIDSTPARCLVNAARDVDLTEFAQGEPGEQGYFADCFDLPCVDDEDTARKLRGSGKQRKLCSETVTKTRKNREP